MLRRLALFLALLTGFCGFGFYYHHGNTATPPYVTGLVLNQQTLDLGEIPIGLEKPFAATLTNYGPHVASIERIDSSCGCTEVRADSKSCQPWEAITLTGKLRPAAKAGDFQHRVAIVERSDPPRVHILILTGSIKATIRPSQDHLVLAPDPIANKSAEATLEIGNHSDETVALQLSATVPPGVGQSLDKGNLLPGESARLTVTVEPVNLLEAAFSITITTNHDRERSVSIPVRVTSPSHLKLAPSSFHLGVIPKHDLLTSKPVTLRLLGSSLSLLTIQAIDTPPYLRLARTVDHGPGNLELQFTFQDSFAGMDLASAISIDFELKTLSSNGVKRTFRACIPITGILNNA